MSEPIPLVGGPFNGKRFFFKEPPLFIQLPVQESMWSAFNTFNAVPSTYTVTTVAYRLQTIHGPNNQKKHFYAPMEMSPWEAIEYLVDHYGTGTR